MLQHAVKPHDNLPSIIKSHPQIDWLQVRRSILTWVLTWAEIAFLLFPNVCSSGIAFVRLSIDKSTSQENMLASLDWIVRKKKILVYSGLLLLLQGSESKPLTIVVFSLADTVIDFWQLRVEVYPHSCP